MVENAVKNAQGQFRVIKDALESRRGERLEEERRAVCWQIARAASGERT